MKEAIHRHQLMTSHVRLDLDRAPDEGGNPSSSADEGGNPSSAAAAKRTQSRWAA
jgi:hypothetical protein